MVLSWGDTRLSIDRGCGATVWATSCKSPPADLPSTSDSLPARRAASLPWGGPGRGRPTTVPAARPGAAVPPDKREWTSRLEVALDRFRVADVFIGDVGGTVVLGDEALRAEKLRVDTGIGKLTVDGAFRFASEDLSYEGDVKMERLEFAPLLERLGVPRSKCTQTFDGGIHVLGTGRPFHLLALTDTDVTNFGVFDTSFRNDSKLTILDLERAHAVGGVEVDSEKLVIIPTDATTGDSKHLVTGMYRFADDHFTLDIVSDPLVTGDLGELLEIGIGGSGPTHTLLDGPLTNPTITAEMTLRTSAT